MPALTEPPRRSLRAIARLPVVELSHVLDEAAIEKASLDLLETAAQSQAGLERAARWLAAIGEELFAALASGRLEFGE
ncbi:MAG TPA: hypothetical protein VIS78_01780 [Blastocatellia bacterium]